MALVALVDMVIACIDLEHRIARSHIGLYVVHGRVTDARYLPTKVCRPHETGFHHEQPLVQSDDQLPIHAFYAKPDMRILVHAEPKEPREKKVKGPGVRGREKRVKGPSARRRGKSS